ncbi:MAG: hypothetical protein ACLSAP_10725 [Oscillospiraceae bacterium]
MFTRMWADSECGHRHEIAKVRSIELIDEQYSAHCWKDAHMKVIKSRFCPTMPPLALKTHTSDRCYLIYQPFGQDALRRLSMKNMPRKPAFILRKGQR